MKRDEVINNQDFDNEKFQQFMGEKLDNIRQELVQELEESKDLEERLVTVEENIETIEESMPIETHQEWVETVEELRREVKDIINEARDLENKAQRTNGHLGDIAGLFIEKEHLED